MPLKRRRDLFDHPEWILELKYDGFRVLAFATGGGDRNRCLRGPPLTDGARP